MGQRRRPPQAIRRINYKQLRRDVDQLTERVPELENAQRRQDPLPPKSHAASAGCEPSRSGAKA